METSKDLIPVILESPPLEATEITPNIDAVSSSSQPISVDDYMANEYPLRNTANKGTSDTIGTGKTHALPSIKKQCIGGKVKMEPKTLLDIPQNSALNSLKISQQPYGSATGNPRNKTALRPGCSLMDWIRLTKTPGKDLSGRGGRYVNVTPSELKKHSKRNDAWMAINGLVFNVTGNI